MAPGKKGKGLTIGILLGKPEKKPGMGMMKGGPDGMQDEDEGEGQGEVEEEEPDSELPPGLVEAVAEFRSATDDESAARAFKAAMDCCEDM